MSISHSYIAELEGLILNTLLPVYTKYQESKGVLNPLKEINSSLLIRVKSKKVLPALLRPKEI